MLYCLNNENCYLKNITKHVPNLPHHKTIEHEQQFPHFVYKCRLNQSTGIFLFENSSKKNLHFRGIFTHQWILQITNSRLLEEATDWFTQCFFFFLVNDSTSVALCQCWTSILYALQTVDSPCFVPIQMIFSGISNLNKANFQIIIYVLRNCKTDATSLYAIITLNQSQLYPSLWYDIR